MPPRAKTIQQLERELAAKQQVVNKLLAKRAKIDRQIAALTGGVVVAGDVAPVAARKVGRPPGRKAGGAKRGRPRGDNTLAAAVMGVLKKAGEPMRAKAIEKAVRSAGYKTAAKDFYGIVAAALRDTPGIKRVKRGVYTLA